MTKTGEDIRSFSTFINFMIKAHFNQTPCIESKRIVIGYQIMTLTITLNPLYRFYNKPNLVKTRNHDYYWCLGKHRPNLIKISQLNYDNWDLGTSLFI